MEVVCNIKLMLKFVAGVHGRRGNQQPVARGSLPRYIGPDTHTTAPPRKKKHLIWSMTINGISAPAPRPLEM